VPALVILVLAIIGLIFFWRYTAKPQPAGPPQISGETALAPPAGTPLAQGPRVPVFEGRAIGGQRFSFPNDYKGKLVMLDFWATWCRPCVSEIPNVVEAYNKFHPHGLEILGVTLDRIPPTEVTRFTQSSKASWPQIYENALSIAGLFQVRGIPSAFLVDGDTGRLLASGEDLRGTSLHTTIQKYLEQKKGSRDDGK
jgi:thiol-disulfide isomerase/thioredoxin